jgi:hypothetical protein
LASRGNRRRGGRSGSSRWMSLRLRKRSPRPSTRHRTSAVAELIVSVTRSAA